MTSGAVAERVSSRDLYNEYDMKFTADISRQMQMPDRLAAGDNLSRMDGFVDSSNIFSANTPAFGMTMPDRIFLGESEFIMDSSLPAADDYADDDESIENYSDQGEPQSYRIDVTPVKRKEHTDLFASGDMVVPATPGSMLRDNSQPGGGDTLSDWKKIQRHVAKLTCRVERLEEENSRRRQREWLLYPLVIGYCMLHLARLFIRTK